MLAVILVGLAAAWYAIEVRHQVRVTVFQPFRMATVVRGIALVFVAGRLVALWRAGGLVGAAAGHPDRGGVYRRLAAGRGDPG